MSQKIRLEDLIKINDWVYEIPQEFRADMRVPARVFTNESMLEDILEDRSLWQLVNVATLPGIQKYALAMPDIHEGYGFPIGGVAGTAINDGGVISPGGIGYDINCGVRLLAGNLSSTDIKPYLEDFATELFNTVPSGVGQGGRITLVGKEMDEVLMMGARAMIERGYGVESDVVHCEEQGNMPGADAKAVSKEAKQRGSDQLGTLGSGNHFLEVQYVDEIFDEQAARAFGLHKGMVTVMIHCGSRGLGHQTCTDYVRRMMPEMGKWGFVLPDRELVCAPFSSTQAQEYFSAMVAAANFAWANRHTIGHWVRKAWRKMVSSEVELNTIYDVSHNIGKREWHMVNGKKTELLMHRKGATRAFGPGSLETPQAYRSVGQPVLIPGTMGTASYVLVGTDAGMDITFGSSCHGAGRKMSRMKAKNMVRGTTLRKELARQGIIIRCDSEAGLAEEAPIAYKDVESVVDVVQQVKIANKVARLKPLAVIKGG